MKPSLTLFDSCGQLHRDPASTRTRLIRGGSWRRQRIVVVIPAGEAMATRVALSHWALVFPPNNGVVRILAQGLEVGEAYSCAIEQVLAHPELSQWEYLLTIEHDNLPPADGVLRLVAQLEAHSELAGVGGLYFTKGEGGVAQIWGDVSDPVVNFRPQPPQPGALVECCGTGMGFNLWRLKMFKDPRLRRPWFRTQIGKDGACTQDLYFATDARKYGYRFAIDCAVCVGHHDATTDIVW